jgi:Fe-S cluster assembly protein SufD
MTQLAERHETYHREFEAFRRDAAFGAGSVGRRRERAFERFLEAGFPTTRDEEWRYTNVAPIAAGAFMRAPAASPDRATVAPFLFDGVGPQIVLVNGRVSRTLSALEALPAGVSIETVADAVRKGDDVDEDGATPPSGPFVNLNDAFVEDGVRLRVAPRTLVSAPIHVLALTMAGDRPVLVVPRVSVRVGEAAEVTVIESYAGLGPGQSFTSAVTTVHLDPGAIVDHVKVQRETDSAFHLATLSIRLGRASTFTSHALTLGGRIARNDILAVLDGEGSECTLNGLYVATGERLVDTHTTIDHARPHCPSHEVYKGILAGRARAVFNGKILVRPDAQKTDAKQTNRALLLSDEAQVNTKPQLEIFADDVKCTHGAAIGQLDEDALFYLRARGIDERAARVMMIHAFAGDILERIATPSVRSAAMRAVERQLAIG